MAVLRWLPRRMEKVDRVSCFVLEVGLFVLF